MNNTQQTESRRMKKHTAMTLIGLGVFILVGIFLGLLFSQSRIEWRVSNIIAAIFAICGMSLLLFSKPIGNLIYKINSMFLSALHGWSKEEVSEQMKGFWSRGYAVWVVRLAGAIWLLAVVYFVLMP